MPSSLLLPTSIVFGLIAFGLIARWYVLPILRTRTREEALVPLLLLHAFRYVGLAFLLPGVTAEVLDPRFAVPAAYGDLLAAVLALVAVVALRREWRIALPAAWLFNIFGLLDLLNAVYQGLRYTPDGALGATYFTPAVVVPALLVTHVLIFGLLVHRSTTDERLQPAPASPLSSPSSTMQR